MGLILIGWVGHKVDGLDLKLFVLSVLILLGLSKLTTQISK